MSEAELDELVVRVKARDLDALARVYDLLYDRVYRYVNAQVRNRHTAEDITSQVFVDLLENVDRFMPGRPGGFAAWMFRIARNDVIDHQRRMARRPTTDLEAVAEVASDGIDLGDEVVRALQAAEAWSALRGLTHEQRQVVMLRFGAELATDEVAAVMGKSAGAVKLLQHRAVQALKNMLVEGPRQANNGNGNGNGNGHGARTPLVMREVTA